MGLELVGRETLTGGCPGPGEPGKQHRHWLSGWGVQQPAQGGHVESPLPRNQVL